MSLMALGSCTKYGPTRPNRMIPPTRMSPKTSHGVRVGSIERQRDRGLREATEAAAMLTVLSSTAGSVVCWRFVMIVSLSGGSATRPGARVDEAGEEVDDQVGAQHGEGDEEEDPLHQGVVVVRHGGEQLRADAGIR